MLSEYTIVDVHGREILDSRGNPTIQAEVTAARGLELVRGVASVPSGASTGKFEAVELRDGTAHYRGKGVQRAVSHINNELKRELINMDICNQMTIDRKMIRLDGTQNKGRLGANAILGVSLAVARAAANAHHLPLYQYLGGVYAHKWPVPMMNILNGGVHADNTVDFQEFMIMPVGAKSFREALEMGANVYAKLKDILKKEGKNTAVGDEGGFAPDLKDAFEVFDYLTLAIQNAGYTPGQDVSFAMDAAASELYHEDTGTYYFPGEGTRRNAEEMIDYYEKLCTRYPVISIEDGLDEEDWEGWKQLTERIGSHVQLVGDDLFVTNPDRLKKGIQMGAGNAILIKVNQIGTLTEAMSAIEMAKSNGYRVVVSHRSGETEDSFIADLAVSVNAGQIKTGAPCRSERVAKYNRLLRIEEMFEAD